MLTTTLRCEVIYSYRSSPIGTPRSRLGTETIASSSRQRARPILDYGILIGNRNDTLMNRMHWSTSCAASASIESPRATPRKARSRSRSALSPRPHAARCWRVHEAQRLAQLRAR
eukprot:6199686-Pleurochrysis_carterae.AAC.2